MMKKNDFRGDQTDISANKEALVPGDDGHSNVSSSVEEYWT